MVETILVGLASFFVIGTALALVLCGAARGSNPPVPTRADNADDRAHVAQVG